MAERARVTHDLVTRRFLSKARPFRAAMPGARDVAEFVAGDLESPLGRVARMEASGGHDPCPALIPSALSDEEAAAHLEPRRRDDGPGRPGAGRTCSART